MIIPKEILTQHHLDKGAKLHITSTPTGFHVSVYDEDFNRQMALAERVMKEDRDILKKLAE